MEIKNIIENEINNIENNENIVKKKRGRPKKNKIDEINNNDNSNNISIIPVSGIVNLIFDRLKVSTLTETESNILDESFTKVINKYIALNYTDEINLTLILLIIISSRYNEYKKSKHNSGQDRDRQVVSDKKESE